MNNIRYFACLYIFVFGFSITYPLQAKPYRIVTTIGMIHDITQEVAGNKAVSHNIIGQGIDPHLYKPTRSDIASLLKADVIFYCGLMLEGKMSDTLFRLSKRKKPAVFAVAESLPKSDLHSTKDFPGNYDPHVWMNVQYWTKAVDIVAASLGAFDKQEKSFYEKNAKKYQRELKQLDTYVQRVISTIPEENRVLVTAHDAFHYFGEAYHIEVKGIQGISTESEAGLYTINQLVKTIIRRKIKAIFVETSVSDKNVRALLEGVRSKGHSVHIGGTLFSDAMGTPGTYEGTYIGMIDHNATVIARGLGGEAPPQGMQGKLTLTQ